LNVRKRRHADKTGMPPGTLTYIGSAPTESAQTRRIEYNAQDIRDELLPRHRISDETHLSASNVFVIVEGIHDLETIRTVGRSYGLHPLVLEDVVNTEQRAKVDNYAGYAFAVFRRLTLDTDTESIVRRQYSVVLVGNTVILFTEGGSDPVVTALQQRLKHPASDIRGGSADYLFYAVIDTIADSYFAVADEIARRVDDLEDEVGEREATNILQRISELRRNVVYLRRYLNYAFDTVNRIATGGVPELAPESKVYFEDVRDHVKHVLESAETHRELLNGLLELHLSYQNHRLGEIMKVLTTIATIFIPLTFVAGVYGMNFVHMPELSWRWGYPVVLGGMGIIALGLVLYFRRKRWF
jgi:magnesium transporter